MCELMIRLVDIRSRFVLVGLWILVVATFADASNFDDLVGSATVLHDDEDVTSSSSLNVPVRAYPPIPKQANKPAGPVILIIDQDSPSLAAPEFANEFVVEALAIADRPMVISPLLYSESLHVKLRTLLI